MADTLVFPDTEMPSELIDSDRATMVEWAAPISSARTADTSAQIENTSEPDDEAAKVKRPIVQSQQTGLEAIPFVRLVALKEWEGRILSVDQEEGLFTAHLKPLGSKPEAPLGSKTEASVEIATFPLADVQSF
jgi:hypothetical protein